MIRRFLAAMILAGCTSGAVVLDRIAIVVNERVIKDSDIKRETRITSWINGQPPQFTQEARKSAADRLIDQMLIRHESQLGQYLQATPDDVEKMVARIRKDRYASSAAFSEGLKRYGITEEEIREHLAWQLTVLNFIEQRFRPGVLVSEEEIQQYYQEHLANFQPGADGRPPAMESVRAEVTEQIAGERVNREFFDWLERARNRANIRYREAELQ